MATFPSLAKQPLVPLKEKVIRSTVRSGESERGGYIQTRERWSSAKREWEIRYRLLSSADVSTLDTFFTDTAKGGAVSFTWTHPMTAVDYTVRFKEDTLEWETPTGGSDKRSVRFTLQEV